MPFDKEYAALAAKFKLPALDVIEKEIDLSNCESERFVLRQVRQAMRERIGVWLDLLDEVLSPEQGTSSALFESHFFTDAERNNVFAFYKRLMQNDRALLEALVLADEKSDAEVIRQVWQQWPELKKEVLVIILKLKECWSKDLKREDYVGYLG